MPRLSRVILRTTSAALLGLAVSLVSGCGGGGSGTVSGKVTLSGKPVERGTITFLSEAGNKDAFSAAIQDGQYRTGEMPAGPAKIYLTPLMEMPAKGAAGGDVRPPPKVVKGEVKSGFPDKYTNHESSGLSLDVKRGENTFDVNMIP
jgi:hypothetical protein